MHTINPIYFSISDVKKSWTMVDFCNPSKLILTNLGFKPSCLCGGFPDCICDKNTQIYQLPEVLAFVQSKGFHVMVDCNASGWYWQINRISTGSTLFDYSKYEFKPDYNSALKDGLEFLLIVHQHVLSK